MNYYQLNIFDFFIICSIIYFGDKMNKLKIKDLTMMGLFLAILIVASKISFQIGPIPITLQTLSLALIGLILGPYKGVIVVLIYLVMGLIGIPVFSQGGGFDYIFKPSFGYIIGFIPMILLIGIGRNFNNKSMKYLFSIFGLIIDYIFGVIYMYLIMKYYLDINKDIIELINLGVLPFILKDFLSIILASIVYERLNVFINNEDKNMDIKYNKELF